MALVRADLDEQDTGFGVLALGLLSPRAAPAEALAAVRRAGAGAAARLLLRHKVARIGRATATEWLHGGLPGGEPLDGPTRELLSGLIAELTAALAPADQRHASSPPVLAALRRAAGGAGIPVWEMKGFSIRRWYPPQRPRDVGDLDLLVRTLDHAWALAEVLRADGYGYPEGELPWFKQDVVDRDLYGQVRLVTPARDRISVDFHAGPYSVRHCARMPLARTSAADPAGGWGAVHRLDDLCCVLGNAAGDCFVDAKTVNDLVLALTTGPALTADDVAYVHATLDRALLLPFLATCLDRVAELCRLDGAGAAALAALRPPVAAEPMPPLTGPDAGLRLAVTVEHARHTAGRLPGSTPAQIDHVVRTAEEAYGDDHPPRLAEPGAGSPAGLPELANWVCVRLVPDQVVAGLVGPPAGGAPQPSRVRPLSGRIRVIEYGCGDLVEAGRDRFVPTVDFALPPELARTLLATAGGPR